MLWSLTCARLRRRRCGEVLQDLLRLQAWQFLSQCKLLRQEMPLGVWCDLAFAVHVVAQALCGDSACKHKRTAFLQVKL